MTERAVLVAAFYRFFDLEDPAELCRWAQYRGESLELLGTVLVAPEGVNGTVAGEGARVRLFLEEMVERVPPVGPTDKGFDIKESLCDEPPFRRFRVRVKSEIVTFGQEDADPRRQTGIYLSPREWDRLLEEEGVVLVDTRNDYEIKAGRFPGAVHPETENFREFPRFVEEKLAGLEDRKIAMYCTGGIRCEKATSFLLARNFEHVYHLEGGILRYIEETPVEDSKWQGECFVFDRRVALDQELAPGQHEMCWMCGWPLDEEDRRHEHFEAGISCANCFGKPTREELSRARERHRQAELDKQRRLEADEAGGPSTSGATR